MPKIDLKKLDWYKPSTKEPSVVTIPRLLFAMVDGVGDPNKKDFKQAVEALYAISYGIKMLPKKGPKPAGYFEYVVPPLEALWWMEGKSFDISKRNSWQWTAMIMQPEFVTMELFKAVKALVKAKKSNHKIDDVRLNQFEEGQAVQILHIGSYSKEPADIQKLTDFAKDNGYELVGKHHEVYLNDPQKTAEDKLKTILRHPIRKKGKT